MRDRRVLFINRSYWPDAEATGQLLTELCEDLADTYDVSVVCGRVNRNPSEVSVTAHGRLERNGVKVYRVWHTNFNKRHFAGRICNMVTFLGMSSVKGLLLRRADVVVVETDPPLLCLLGRVLQVVKRSRLICYLQDIYPDVAVALGKLREGVVAKLLSWLFYGTYRKANHVVVLSDDMSEHLVRQGVPSTKVSRISNWVDCQQVTPVKDNNPFRKKHKLDGKMVVMYSGNMGFSQPLDKLVSAAAELSHEEHIQFVLAGNGAGRAELEADIAQRQLPNLRLLDYQPKSQLAQSLSAADLHIVFLDERITSFLMPSKIYGILGSGTASLVVADADSELARVVTTYDVGRVLPPGQLSSLGAVIADLCRDRQTLVEMGRRARDLAMQQYDRRYAAEKFTDVIRALA